jgi:hypothetical protein
MVGRSPAARHGRGGGLRHARLNLGGRKCAEPNTSHRDFSDAATVVTANSKDVLQVPRAKHRWAAQRALAECRTVSRRSLNLPRRVEGGLWVSTCRFTAARS